MVALLPARWGPQSGVEQAAQHHRLQVRFECPGSAGFLPVPPSDRVVFEGTSSA